MPDVVHSDRFGKQSGERDRVAQQLASALQHATVQQETCHGHCGRVGLRRARRLDDRYG